MTDIIQLAKQAGGTAYTNRHYPGETAMAFGPDALERFAELIRADQKEVDAKVCEEMFSYGALDIADAIRARTTP